MKSNTLICSLLLFFNAFATYADNIKGPVGGINLVHT